MSKRLKLYKNESEYLIAQNQQSFNQYTPNVVYCVGENKSFYNNISSNNTIYDDRQYIKFEDTEIERVCALNFGDYNKITTIDNNNNTVTVITEFVSTGNGDPIELSRITRQIEETDIVGTQKHAIGTTYRQADNVKTFGTIFSGNNSYYEHTDLKHFGCMNYNIDNFYIERNNYKYGTTNSQYYTTPYIKVQPSSSITFGIDYFFLYGRDFVYVDWWSGAYGSSRTIGLSSKSYYLRASILKQNAGNYYIYNNTTGEYIIKGENVT